MYACIIKTEKISKQKNIHKKKKLTKTNTNKYYGKNAFDEHQIHKRFQC